MLVLIASLSTTLISIFSVLISILERVNGIDSVYGAPRDPSDTVLHWTSTQFGALVMASEVGQLRVDQCNQSLDAALERIRELEGVLRDLVPGASDRLSADRERTRSVHAAGTRMFSKSVVVARPEYAPPTMSGDVQLQTMWSASAVCEESGSVDYVAMSSEDGD